MKNSVLLLSVVALMLLAACSTDQGSSEQVPTDPTVPAEVDAAVKEIFILTNQARAQGRDCGGSRGFMPAVPPLEWHDALGTAARLHSEDMAQRGYFDHTSPEGSSPRQRAAAAGYSGGVGENIAAGSSTAEGTMQQWLTSPGHCANIMNPSYKYFGAGTGYNAESRFRYYWTQLFG